MPQRTSSINWTVAHYLTAVFLCPCVREALYCSGVPSITAVQISSQIVTVLSINIINYLLFYSSTWLSAFEKHHTRSSEARSLTFKLFLSQVCLAQACCVRFGCD